MATPDSTPIEIRGLRSPGEAEACAAMMASSEPWVTLRRSYEGVLKMVNDPAREVYLAVKGAEVLGCIVLNMRGAFVGYIQSICVAAAWRGRGIGARLVAYAEKRIFSESPNVFLCVSSFNAGARQLYELLGYEVVGELRDYIVTGYSEILMRKTIAPLAEFKARDR